MLPAQKTPQNGDPQEVKRRVTRAETRPLDDGKRKAADRARRDAKAICPWPRLWRRARKHESHADREEWHEVRKRTGHPHQHARSRLVIEWRKAESGLLHIVRIKRPIGEDKERRQQGVLHVGRDQIGDQEPWRPLRSAWIWPDHRKPEQQPRREKTGMLGVVPPVGSQREFVRRRQVPDPGGRREQYPCGQRMCQDLEYSTLERPAQEGHNPKG